MRARDLAVLLPNWASLQWSQVPPNLLSQAESSSRDGEYQVSIRAVPGSEKQHRDMVDAFRRFMAQG